ncbi:MAG TPA: DNA mismatch repair protein MutS, partial [Bacteroidota bacterium]
VLQQRQNNFLACIALPSAIANADDLAGLAFIDVSTGEFSTGEIPLRHLPGHLANLQPAEMLVQKRDKSTIENLLKPPFSTVYTTLDDWVFNAGYGYDLLIQHFKTQSLKGFGIEEMKQGIAAAGAIMNYLQETQKSNLPHIRKITLHEAGEHVILDGPTKRNLEITSTIQGQAEGSLFSVLDRTQTPMGGRLLKKWVHRPLKNVAAILERQSVIAELHEQTSIRRELLSELENIGDLERLIAKIATGRATPRELNQLKEFLSRTPELVRILATLETGVMVKLWKSLNPLTEVVESIEASLNEDAPMSLADGGVIRKGRSAELDELRELAFSGKDWIARLQEQERRRTGISSLKVGYNNVFGYYLEVTNAHKEKVPQDYIRKQTLTNAERYVTPALKEYEEKILHAEEQILALESRLFNELRERVSSFAGEIQHNASVIAVLDCSAGLADVAAEFQYCRPMVDESTVIDIQAGRHPVIERLLPPGETYTANDTLLDTSAGQIIILTGPNMSG